MSIWQLQEAKNKFSAVVNKALTEGPQFVTRHGVEAVVVMSAEQYREVTGASENFKDFLLAVPLDEVDLERGGQAGRPVDL